jgi:stalled ribosome rescue protein Dom34
MVGCNCPTNRNLEEKMNGIILYQSKYGATKKYADWISEETGLSCVETKKAVIDDIVNYDTIILGGGIYASGIADTLLNREEIILLCLVIFLLSSVGRAFGC